MTPESIERAIDAGFASMPTRKRTWRAPSTSAERAKAVAMWQSGMLPKQIAAALGYDVAWARMHVRRAVGGISAFKAGRNRRIADLWRQGATGTEIAADLGMTPNAVKAMVRLLRSRGEDLPRRRRQ